MELITVVKGFAVQAPGERHHFSHAVKVLDLARVELKFLILFVHLKIQGH